MGDVMANKKNIILGEKLKGLRNAFEMTQDDIASVLNMSRTTFSKYENGVAIPPLSVMRKLSAIFGVKLEYLIYDDNVSVVFNDGKNKEEPDNNDVVSTFSDLSHDERIMIMKMRLMSAQKKEEIKKVIDDAGED
jgi:transcriptional regulator with XRE-family HTH domain